MSRLDSILAERQGEFGDDVIGDDVIVYTGEVKKIGGITITMPSAIEERYLTLKKELAGKATKKVANQKRYKRKEARTNKLGPHVDNSSIEEDVGVLPLGWRRPRLVLTHDSDSEGEYGGESENGELGDDVVAGSFGEDHDDDSISFDTICF